MKFLDKLPVTEENLPYWSKASLARVVEGNVLIVNVERGLLPALPGVIIRVDGIDVQQIRDIARPADIGDEEWKTLQRKGETVLACTTKAIPVGSPLMLLATGIDDGVAAARVFVPGADKENRWMELAEWLRSQGYERPVAKVETPPPAEPGKLLKPGEKDDPGKKGKLEENPKGKPKK